MKIAFDEHVPPLIVKVFKILATEGDTLECDIVSARDYHTKPEDTDVPWLSRFKDDGGTVVISGDRKMRSSLHEQAALVESGLIGFFFEASWNNGNHFVKSAMLLNWWPKILEKLETAEPGSLWEVPFQWTWKDLKDVSRKR